MPRRKNTERTNEIRKLIKGNPEIAAESINEEMKKRTLDVTSKTLYSDIKELGYIRRNGKYILSSRAARRRNRVILKELFDLDTPEIYTFIPNENILLIMISTGYEQTFAQTIYSIYRKKVIGVLPGIGCIQIIAKDNNSLEIIKDELFKVKTSSSD